MPRLTWDQLPTEARAAIEQHTGPIHWTSDASDGKNSALATRLGVQSGAVFVKGIQTDNRQVTAQDREAAVNPYLPPSCPRLLWRVQTAGWDLLGYELLQDARAADYTPGSPDLALVVDALVELANVRCPETPGLRRAGQRWAAYSRPELLPLLDGDQLLHTDLAPDNILIRDGRAHLIDWAWPTLGPSWLDPSVWAIRLMNAGHDAQSAETWVARVPGWHDAPAGAREGFATANASLWAEIQQQTPDDAWRADMAHCAEHWARHLN
ncbi:aminoglycoside phosphotransferase [Cryptosporangium sp. NPDC051539]|uniref:aminoglycoside phosphotransferase n=1 Tax=Cryptosporangium sp. NPDC051539 TaxID=3363962 RepID=UPI003789111B